MISKLTEGLGLTEAGIRYLRTLISTEQIVATTRQRIRRKLAWCEEILKEKRSWSHQISVSVFFKSFPSSACQDWSSYLIRRSSHIREYCHK
jgi:hypothetical protein